MTQRKHSRGRQRKIEKFIARKVQRVHLLDLSRQMCALWGDDPPDHEVEERRSIAAVLDVLSRMGYHVKRKTWIESEVVLYQQEDI